MNVSFVTTAECSSYKEISDADRSIDHRGKVKCDNDIAEGWYRFVGAAGDRIPESAPEELHCGTQAPGWLNGEHPTVSEGNVQRQVCYHWSGNECRWKNDIEITNCGDFFVYKLKTPPVCNCLRFCVKKGDIHDS